MLRKQISWIQFDLFRILCLFNNVIQRQEKLLARICCHVQCIIVAFIIRRMPKRNLGARSPMIVIIEWLSYRLMDQQERACTNVVERHTTKFHQTLCQIGSPWIAVFLMYWLEGVNRVFKFLFFVSSSKALLRQLYVLIDPPRKIHTTKQQLELKRWYMEKSIGYEANGGSNCSTTSWWHPE